MKLLIEAGGPYGLRLYHSPPTLRKVLGWITDFFRIVWGFLYWNSRKSLYRLKRRRGVCPCQNQSDSGKAGVTGCDAAMGFTRPARFRVVCPLLKPAEDGRLMCSVDANEVRPFWGRVIAAITLGIVGSYASIVLAVFLFLQQVGYPVTIRMIGWPPDWSEIDHARSAYFLSNAQESYATGDLNEAVMSLSLAYQFDPYNYNAGFSLARLWQAGRPEYSNQLFQQLIANHPEKRTETAQAWLRSLLPRADYVWIEKLGSMALRFSDGHESAWLHALLFANTRTQNSTLIENILEHPEKLSTEVEKVLRWEQQVRDLPPNLARRVLTQPVPPEEPPFVVYYQIQRLLSLGFSREALDIINAYEDRLGDRDRIVLQLWGFAEAKFRRSHLSLFDRISRLPPSLAQIEIISAHLTTYPDAELYSRAKTRLQPLDLPSAEQQLSGLLSLFCVAGIHRDVAEQDRLMGVIRELTQNKFKILDIAKAVMADPERASENLPNILPALQPLSLDLTYALLDHYDSE
ncbi:MAG: hypothetical protein SynsKO_36760 [Synoicihabitans sp.]